MNLRALLSASIGCLVLSAHAAPVDRPFPGEVQLSVDATDVARRIVHVHETITGLGAGAVLYYPRWLPGVHAPVGPIDRFAGLRMKANGASVPWTRDPLDVFAFRVQNPRALPSLEVDFDYLSPVSSATGSQEMGEDLLVLDWVETILYPAGYFARQIPATASLKLPANWKFASALEVAATNASTVQFKRLNVEQLVDSPVMAGRYAAVQDLDPGSRIPVRLQLFGDRADQLELKPEQLKSFRSLVQQAYKLFGSQHYTHYDFLLALSDHIDFGVGLEHQQSTELKLDPDWFRKWDDWFGRRDDPPHELVHSWNGKFRRPADLWTPNFNVPMQNSLLWLYEGQTQYWGYVLTARSGLWSQEQILDRLAVNAAYAEVQSGRQFRALQDTTNDEIINPRRPQSWSDWQRFEDYYIEGMLFWMEADTLIRERSGDQRSLDDFARAFFGVEPGNTGTLTYAFDDIVRTLNTVEPYDWVGFLRQRLDTTARPTLLDGLRAGGYQLVYTDTPGDLQDKANGSLKRDDFVYSLGLSIMTEDNTIRSVLWGSPAFRAGLISGLKLLAVNGEAYKVDVLKRAITAAKGTGESIELIVMDADRYRTVRLDYHGGLRYPHLQRNAQDRARLDDILKPR